MFNIFDLFISPVIFYLLCLTLMEYISDKLILTPAKICIWCLMSWCPDVANIRQEKILWSEGASLKLHLADNSSEWFKCLTWLFTSTNVILMSTYTLKCFPPDFCKNCCRKCEIAVMSKNFWNQINFEWN